MVYFNTENEKNKEIMLNIFILNYVLIESLFKLKHFVSRTGLK